MPDGSTGVEFGEWQSPTRWDQTRDSAQVPGGLRARLHQRPEHTLEPAHPAASHPHPAPGAPGTGGSGGRRPSEPSGLGPGPLSIQALGHLLVLRLRRRGLNRPHPSRCKAGSLTSGPPGKPPGCCPLPGCPILTHATQAGTAMRPRSAAPQAVKPGVPQPWAPSRGQSRPQTHPPP